MSRFLVVLHRVDADAALVERCRRLAAADPSAEFVLLVPATHVRFTDLLEDPSCNGRTLARRRAQQARNLMLGAGLTLRATRLGNWDPMRAVEDALRFNTFTAVLVASAPHPVLRRLRTDLAGRIAAQFPELAVMHSEVAPAPSRGRDDRTLAPTGLGPA